MDKRFLFIACAAAASTAGAADPPKRPNILFCIADDASFHHFGAAGCRWVETPNFDRIAREGLFFENCYTPNAKSAPSRAAILTGRYSWQLKEAGNHISNFPAEFKVFTEALADNGYDVAFTGKGWAPGNPGTKDGEPRLLTGKPYQSRQKEPPTKEISRTDYAANFADFLDENGGGNPWFFWFGSREPHRKYEYGSGVSVAGKNISQIDNVPAFWPDNPAVRNDMLDYALEIEYYDRCLGEMLAELEKRGALSDVLLIVTSDNGMPFPRSKANNYEYSHHMPLAVMWLGAIEAPGRRIGDYVSFVDYAPTILEAAGVVQSKSGMQPVAGESFLPILKNKKTRKAVRHRDRIIFGRERDDYGRPQNQGYPIRGVIRDGWMYVNNLEPERYPAGNPETGYLDIDGSPTKTEILRLWRSGADSIYYALSMGKRPAEELYHIAVDTDCIHNLASDAAQQNRKIALREELLEALREQGDPRMQGEGDVFDRYPFDSPDKWDFYERVVGGRISEPWKQTPWVSPSDYEQYGGK